ncbi:MAG: hypothetical protein U9N77_06930 [Thermodesulfobacteriota bacterium]|nr:hypothetical protein [Thermodesulfobacteriota bacterium]
MKKLSVCIVFLFAAFIIPGCGSGDDSDYEGVGKLVADRNKARFSHSDTNARENRVGKPAIKLDSVSKAKKPRGREMIFEETVKIVVVSTGKTIATATAYLDKSGKIVNIRIKRD